MELNHQHAPLHCEVLFADGVVEEFNAVVVHHRLHEEQQKNSLLLMEHFLQAIKNSVFVVQSVFVMQ